MKKVICLSILLLNTLLLGQWKTIPSNNNIPLYSAQFFDSTSGIIVGANGLILNSTDGGRNWVPNPSYYNYAPDLYSVSLYNKTSGWICGRGGTLLQTTDKGNTWVSKYFSPGYYYLTHIVFLNDSVGWMCGATNSLFRTKFGDGFWTQEYITRNNNAYGYLYTKDGQTGYLVGDSGKAVKTTDHGYSWISLNTGTTNKIENVTFVSDSMGWMVGEKGTILKTTDGGQNWASYGGFSQYHFNWVTFANNKVGWIVGSNGSILKTIDSGVTWDSVASGTKASLRMISFEDANHGIIVGDSGKILLYDTSYITSVNNKGIKNYPYVFNISQNYPNPFNPTTKIKYSLPQRSNIKIEVFNTLGEKIKDLVNDQKNSGEYEVSFNTTGLASGVYFYMIEAKSIDGKNEFRDVKKMVLLK